MVTLERNRHIYEIHKAHPTWTYQDIGELVGISRQRVEQIVRKEEARDIIDIEMEPKNKYQINGQSISATQAARVTGIPVGTISRWVFDGEVKVIAHPGQTGPGKVVLLDPVTLQERMNRYQPRPRRNRVSV